MRKPCAGRTMPIRCEYPPSDRHVSSGGQRRRALRQKLVYVSPELVRDLTTYAKDAGGTAEGVGPSGPLRRV